MTPQTTFEHHRQVRVRTITESGDDLLRFYSLVIQPHQANLIRAVAVFEQKMLPLIGWLLESEGKIAWKWHSAVLPRPGYHSIRYSRNDELLAALQDHQFRTAFEKAYRLWVEYLTIFTGVLAHPDVAERFCDKARSWLSAHSTDSAAIRTASTRCLSVVRNAEFLQNWGRTPE